MKMLLVFTCGLWAACCSAVAQDTIELKAGDKLTRAVKIEQPRPANQENEDGEEATKEQEPPPPKPGTRTYTIENVSPLAGKGFAVLEGSFVFDYPGNAEGKFWGYYDTDADGGQPIKLYGIGTDESPGGITTPVVSGSLMRKVAEDSDGDAGGESEGDSSEPPTEETGEPAPPEPVANLTTSDSHGNSEEGYSEYRIE